MRAYSVVLMFLSSLASIETLGCDCKTFTQAEEFNRVSQVFVGKILLAREDGFSTIVYERFKGDGADTLIFVVDDCSILAGEGEVWLIYAERAIDGKFHASICGYSRNFRAPFVLQKPIDQSPNGELTLGMVMTKISRIEAYAELESDLYRLRRDYEISMQKGPVNGPENIEVIQLLELIKIGLWVNSFLLLVTILMIIIRFKR